MTVTTRLAKIVWKQSALHRSRSASHSENSVVSGQPIGTLVSSVWKNPDVIPKVSLFVGDLNPHPNYTCFLG